MFNFNLCELSAMTILLAIVLATLHLENDDLVTLYKWVHNLTYYFSAIYGRCANLYCSIVIHEQYLLKLNSLAFLYVLHVVDEELCSFCSLKLLTVNFYNCVHYFLLNGFPLRGGHASCCHFTKPLQTKSAAKVLIKKKNEE